MPHIARMEKLISTYLDGDIPKESYLTRKDKIMRTLATLKEEMKDFERGRNQWVEPLREWIIDTKQAAFLSSSSDFHQIASFVKRVGTNPRVSDKTARFGASVPSVFVAKRRAFLPVPAPAARASSALSEREVTCCGRGGIRTPEGVAPLPLFESGAFNLSATLPILYSLYSIASLIDSLLPYLGK